MNTNCPENCALCAQDELDEVVKKRENEEESFFDDRPDNESEDTCVVEPSQDE